MGEHQRQRIDELLPQRPSWNRLLPRNSALLGLAALALTLGCNFVTQALQASPAPEGTPAIETLGLTPPAEEPTPATTPAVLTTAPAPAGELPEVLGQACVPEGEPEVLSAADFEDYPRAIEDYLNEGATPGMLEAALAEAGVGSLPVAVAAGDLTGDGIADVAVSVFDPAATGALPEGALLLYACEWGAYQLALVQSSEELADDEGLAGPPHLWALGDLDDDERAELVVSVPTCGAHTCFEHLSILGWEEGGFEDRLAGETGDLPNPNVEVRDPDGDGLFEVAVIGGGISSVGAGPQRALERVWRLYGGRWQVAAEVPGPSNFRIHALHDAEAAALAGEAEAALVLYERVIDDEALEDWMAPEEERAVLGAYARFREVVLYTRLGREAFAEVALDEMEAAYPAGAAEHVYVVMARLYREGFASGGVAVGCEAARRFAGNHASVVLDPLGPEQFGYGNRSFTAEDVCVLEEVQPLG